MASTPPPGKSKPGFFKRLSKAIQQASPSRPQISQEISASTVSLSPPAETSAIAAAMQRSHPISSSISNIPVLTAQPTDPSTQHGASSLPDHTELKIDQPGLKPALQALQKAASVFPPLKPAIDALISCLSATTKNKSEYETLLSELEMLADFLAQHKETSASFQNSGSLKHIAFSIEQEANLIAGKKTRSTGGRLRNAEMYEDDIVGHLRQIESLFRQLQVNVTLSTQSIAKAHLVDTQLEKLNPSKLARYDSEQSKDMARRMCTEKTRVDVLKGLGDWSHDPSLADMYWMNGMAAVYSLRTLVIPSTGMEQNFRQRNWAWELFYYDGSKYLRNKSHRNAWCKGCLRFRSIALKEEDELQVLSGKIEMIRSGEEHEQQALNDVDPICGKIYKLHSHLARCPHVDRKARHRALLDQARPSCNRNSAVLPIDRPNLEPPVGQQEWFDRALCRTAVSAGWSWNSLNDPEFVSMMKVLQPGLKIPDRRTLSGRILNQEVDRVVGNLKTLVKGHLATGMCDGWKNVAKTSLVASMITVNYQAHITHIRDVSASWKTAGNLLSIVIEEIKYAEDLGAKIVAWCSDASGESRAMRHRLYALMPRLITLDCYAHQINLVVGDLFKHVEGMAGIANNANKIIKWFNNHSFALGMLRQCQEIEYGRTFALIAAVLTRWTTHYCSVARLLEVVNALIICVMRHEATLLESAGPANSEGQKAAKEVFAFVKDLKFWEGVTRMKTLLQPLAVAANITQASDTRLDHVVVTMGNLYDIFSKEEIPEHARTVILESLEKRWAKSDQDAFIAAIYFNPFYKHHLFNPEELALRPLGLYSMLKRLFARVFPDEILHLGNFLNSNELYASGKGVFSDEHMYLQELQEQSGTDNAHITLLHIWGNLAAAGPKSGVQQFAQLAECILSIVPNSAGCERLFSQMGIAHTKLRNRLTMNSSCKIVQLKMDLWAGHKCEGLVQPRSQRHYGQPSMPVFDEEDLQDDDDVPQLDPDAHNLIGDLIADADADEDLHDESEQGDGNNGTDKDIEVEEERDIREHPRDHALPRIIFRWTGEISLARLFDYSPRTGNENSWSNARGIWLGGVANLESEIHHYGLADAFGETNDVEMND
ncbi:HAT family dimerization protein [Ceratobasidium theobromae]|uniref:HAT family dimerization protein n=1 Tax=Ceratobasidium theobromae TaxID=1582974 RepID=A0A5N5QBE8_9AGAM|nr:HAT family dimerization protein [Ceratobasidium theobromae]